MLNFTPPAVWPERPTQVWKVPAGIGHSSPIVAGDRAYLFSRVGEQEVLTAFDVASGKQVWRQGYDAPYQMNPAATSHGKGPKSTPVLDRGRIFTLGISGILSACDQSTGKVAWRHDFAKEFSPSMPDFGASMSPIVDGEQLIAHVGGTSARSSRSIAPPARECGRGRRTDPPMRRRSLPRLPARDSSSRRRAPTSLDSRRLMARTVAGAVHDRLRAEHHHAGRRRWTADLLRPVETDHRRRVVQEGGSWKLRRSGATRMCRCT